MTRSRRLLLNWVAPFACLAIFTLSPPALRAAEGTRDWKTYPAIVVIDQPPELYAIGDIHGDYDKLVALLAGAKIIKEPPARPESVEWAARKGLLVCTGDMVDKGPKSVEVLRFMRALQASAQSAGGQVIITLGNHEAEFLAGSRGNKKNQDFADELKLMHINPAAVQAGTDAEGIGAWLRTRPIAAKVGDWFFCHAGNTGGSTVQKLESDIETGVDKDGFGTFVLAQPNSILEAKTAPVPWWITGNAGAEEENKGDKDPKFPGAAKLSKYVQALGCQHLVMGHQPGVINFGAGIKRKKSEPFAYAGILFLMDTGMSRGVDDANAVLLKIVTRPKPSVCTIDSSGASSQLWAAE